MVIFMLIFNFSFAGLAPNFCGIQINQLSKQIDEQRVYNGGLYYLGFFQGFYEFPLHIQTIDYIGETVATADLLSYTVSFSAQYRLRNTEKGEIIWLYKNYQNNEQIRSQLKSLLLAAVKEVSTSQITSEMYTEDRRNVRTIFEAKIKDVFDGVGVTLEKFLLYNIEVEASLNRKINEKVVESQIKKKTQFEQASALLVKEIDQFNANANAFKNVLLAEANAYGVEVVANAEAAGFRNITAVRSTAYTSAAETLGLTETELMEYLWLRSIKTKAAQGSKFMVGFDGQDTRLRDFLVE